MSNSYKIDLDAVGDYIEYLRRFKKNLEKKQSDFNGDLKKAKAFWDDSKYLLTLEANEKVNREQDKLIDSISKSIKQLTTMRDEYLKYLRRR